jgi:hypothetical protein
MRSPQVIVFAVLCPWGTLSVRGLGSNADGKIRDEPGLVPSAQWATVHAPRLQARSHNRAQLRCIAGPIRFPPDNFKHSLTLISKSFSSFPRDTYSLSVTRQYLALDRVCCPIGVAFPNNPTHRQRLVVQQGLRRTGLSPSPAPLFMVLGPGPSLRSLLQATIRAAWPSWF